MEFSLAFPMEFILPLTSPEEYQFSSYAHYGWGIKDPIITPNPLYENSVGNEDEKKQDYRNMVIDEEKKDKYTI